MNDSGAILLIQSYINANIANKRVINSHTHSYFVPDIYCVGTGFGPMAWVAYGPHWHHLPPPASPAPHRPRLPPCWGVGLAPAVMPGIDLRMWYSASPSMLSPFPYIFASLSLSLCSLDNHFCTIVNSISLFVQDWSQHIVLVYSRRRFLHGETSPFGESHSLWKDWNIRGVYIQKC